MTLVLVADAPLGVVKAGKHRFEHRVDRSIQGRHKSLRYLAAKDRPVLRHFGIDWLLVIQAHEVEGLASELGRRSIGDDELEPARYVTFLKRLRIKQVLLLVVDKDLFGAPRREELIEELSCLTGAYGLLRLRFVHFKDVRHYTRHPCGAWSQLYHSEKFYDK